MDYHQSCFPLQNPVPRIPLCQAGGRILEFLYTLYQNLSIQEHVINVFLPPTAEAVRSCSLGEILGLEAAPYLEDLRQKRAGLHGARQGTRLVAAHPGGAPGAGPALRQ